MRGVDVRTAEDPPWAYMNYSLTWMERKARSDGPEIGIGPRGHALQGRVVYKPALVLGNDCLREES